MELQEEKDFVLRCETDLPKMIMVDGIGYKLYTHGLLGGGFRIIYAEFDGDGFYWKNKPIDLFYNIVELLPPTVEYKEGELRDASIYKINIDDVISDCLEKLQAWHKGEFEVMDEIVLSNRKYSEKIHVSVVSDNLFETLKSEMVEYCSGNNDISLEEQIRYHINEYKKYNHRRKNGYEC